MVGLDANRWVCAALVLAALCACTAPREPRTDVPSAPRTQPARESVPPQVSNAAPSAQSQAPVAAEWKDGTSVLSNAGRYRVVFRRSGDAWPRGSPFGLTVWIFDARDATRPLTDVKLAIDAAMPDHQHGMNRTPVVRASADGRHDVEGVLFHMAGYWELYFDVTRGAHVERTQIGFEVE